MSIFHYLTDNLLLELRVTRNHSSYFFIRLNQKIGVVFGLRFLVYTIQGCFIGLIFCVIIDDFHVTFTVSVALWLFEVGLL